MDTSINQPGLSQGKCVTSNIIHLNQNENNTKEQDVTFYQAAINQATFVPHITQFHSLEKNDPPSLHFPGNLHSEYLSRKLDNTQNLCISHIETNAKAFPSAEAFPAVTEITNCYSSSEIQFLNENPPIQENKSESHQSKDDLDSQKTLDDCICRCTVSAGGKTFTCGGCSKKFPAICCLHIHMVEIETGGSYHFDHVTKTAFPKYDTFCSYAQTDDMLEGRTAYSDYSMKFEDNSEEDEQLEDKDMKKVSSSLDREVKRKHRKTKSKATHKSQNDNNSETSQTKIKVKGRTSNRNRKVNKRYYAEEYGTEEEEEAELETVKKNIKKVKEENLFSGEDFVVTVNDKEVQMKNSDRIPLKKRKISQKYDYNQSSQTNVDLQLPVQDSDTDAHPEFEEIGLPTLPETNKKAEVKTGKVGRKRRSKKTNLSFKKEEVKDMKKCLTCETCGLEVPTRKWKTHQFEHSNERPYVCEKCGKTFKRPRLLKKHLITHDAVKPWPCPICPAQFCQKNEYNVHMRGHAGHRPFVCNVCEMRFLSKRSLLTHQANIHMGLTNFECEVCRRRFYKKSSHEVHVATHFEATMKCNYCDKKFRDKTGLKRHERIHTGVKRYQCHVCKHGFIQSTPFWVHMEKRHGMCRTKVKELLQEVKQTNKNSGIINETASLPEETDKEILLLPKVPVKSEALQAVKPECFDVMPDLAPTPVVVGTININHHHAHQMPSKMGGEVHDVMNVCNTYFTG